MARVALVLVSHSAAAAQGAAEIAAQMAPDVTVLPAGGTDTGIGTSFDRVLAAVEAAAGAVDGDGAGVVVLTDLGSAVLTTESVLEVLDEGAVPVRVPAAPFVEGAVAAAVEAQQGGDVERVESAAVQAGRMFAQPAGAGAATGPESGGSAPPGGDGAPEATGTAVLRNEQGLHARPAAVLARAVADLGIPVTVDGVNGASVLELMRLGVTRGHELRIVAVGEGAQEAVDQLVALVEGGFGEA